MSTTFKRLIDGEVLDLSISTGYTAGTAVKTQIHKLTFTNTQIAAVTVTAHLVPSGGTASDANIIADAHPIEANGTWSCPDAEGHIIEAGGSIQYKAGSVNAITAMASGAEISS